MIIDGVEVPRVLSPVTTGELAEMIRTDEGPFAPVGQGTRLAFGNPLQSVRTVLDTTRMNRICEYVAADMTIHLEAGVRLGDLQATLSERSQMLPLDPWCGPEATLGGIVATNAQGPFRAVGTIRDWVIGMTLVHADGMRSRTGGRVVKNVSGYDLAKLYTGSLGSLGVVAEISLKVRSCYEATASARIELPDVSAAVQMIRDLRTSPLEPVSFVWMGPPNELRVRFGDQRSAIDWQLGQLPQGDWEIFEGEREGMFWDAVRHAYDGLPEPLVRVAVLPDAVGDVVRRFAPRRWLVHAANGILLMSVAPQQILEIREDYPAVIERVALEVRRIIPTFGIQGVEYQIMRDLKTALDPEGRLNPGRHVDGERSE